MPYLVKAVARILVIADDVTIRAPFVQVLPEAAFAPALVRAVRHAGIHALQASQFDVVMVDLFMPGMNGLDTITRIRSGSAVPIIAMSGFRLRNSLDPEQDFLGMAMLRGATTSLRKPFSPPQLVAAIERSLGLTSSTEKKMQ
jgi:CheY-like chemotaxis protein